MCLKWVRIWLVLELEGMPFSFTLLLFVLFTKLQYAAEAQCPSPCICSAKEATCTNVHLTEFPSSRFSKHLEKVDFSYNNISRVDECTIRTWMIFSLRHLNMSNNALRMLNELSFAGQSGLEVLDLSSNELEHISRNTFTHVPRLKWLSLANNELKIPDNSPFLQNMNLQVLHLENCSLNRIVLSSFFGFVNLKELYLSSNKLRTVEMGSITLSRSLANIRYMELSNNNLEDVPHALTQLPSLEDVNIRYNDLRNLSDILLLERHVRRLNISNNPWGYLCEACDLGTICGNITYQVDLCGGWNESENIAHRVSEDIVAIVSEPSIGKMVVMINSSEPQQKTVFTAEYVFVQGWVLGVLCTLGICLGVILVLLAVSQKGGPKFGKSAESSDCLLRVTM